MFLFDLNKSRSNQRKHGISFVEAKQLWKDGDRIEREARFVHEPRFSVTGNIQGRIWTAIITYRSGLIRLISVRPAREHEKEDYFRGRI